MQYATPAVHHTQAQVQVIKQNEFVRSRPLATTTPRYVVAVIGGQVVSVSRNSLSIDCDGCTTIPVDA